MQFLSILISENKYFTWTLTQKMKQKSVALENYA